MKHSLFVTLATVSTLAFSCTNMPELSQVKGVETTKQEKGLDCGTGWTKVTFELNLNNGEKPNVGISGFRQMIAAKGYYINICVSDDGRARLRRIDSLKEPGRTYPEIIKQYGWVDGEASHPSIERAVFDQDTSQIDFRIYNDTDPSESMLFKGWDNGIVSISTYDGRSNNPFKTDSTYLIVGRMSPVAEGDNVKTVSQTFKFETGYVKIKYGFQILHTNNVYQFQQAEVLDTRYYDKVQNLNAAADVKVNLTRHAMNDIMTIDTLGASYVFGNSKGGGTSLTVNYKGDGTKKEFTFDCRGSFWRCPQD